MVPETKEGEAPEPTWGDKTKAGKRHVYIKGRKPKGTSTFCWNGKPTKLTLRGIDLDEGPARLRFHDYIDLTEEQQERHAGYIEKGLLAKNAFPRPPRRSVHTADVQKNPDPEPEK